MMESTHCRCNICEVEAALCLLTRLLRQKSPLTTRYQTALKDELRKLAGPRKASHEHAGRPHAGSDVCKSCEDARQAGVIPKQISGSP